jgi:hypothetical protein
MNFKSPRRNDQFWSLGCSSEPGVNEDPKLEGARFGRRERFMPVRNFLATGLFYRVQADHGPGVNEDPKLEGAND